MNVDTRDGRTHVSLDGALTIRTVSDTHAALAELPLQGDVTVDLSSIGTFARPVPEPGGWP
jgi:hypothetical protein